jgi:beta-lactamase class A
MIGILLGAVLLAVQPADSLTERVEARIAQIPGASAGIAYIDLESGGTFFRNADSSFHAASTMKIPVMIELFRSARSGRLSMKQGILVVNQFASIVDGSPYSLDAASDGDTTLYRRIGRRVPVDTLLRLMITRSSNLATNTLIALVGAEEVTRVMRGLGARNIEVRRGVEDGKAYDRGLNNTTTARDLAVILKAVEDGKDVTPEDREQMLDVLLAQEFNDKIPAGVPKGVRVAHKTGEITAHSHDAAIVYPPGRRPYVLVVLTGGIPNATAADRLIADLSRIVYTHATAGAGATTSRAER